MPRPGMRTMNRLFLALILAPAVLWGLALAAVLVLGGVAGCRIDESSVNPCVVAGLDLSRTAYRLGVTVAWGFFLIAPAMMATGLCWAAVAGVWAYLDNRR